MAIDEAKLGEFMGKVVGDLGAAMSGALVVIGDKLGLYRALAADGGLTPAELARRTETAERYVSEWLNAQAAGGYVTYDPKTGRYALPPEQAFALADDASPAAVAGAFLVVQALGRPCRRPRTTSVRAPASSGDISTRACSRVPSASSGPGTSETS